VPAQLMAGDQANGQIAPAVLLSQRGARIQHGVDQIARYRLAPGLRKAAPSNSGSGGCQTLSRSADHVLQSNNLRFRLRRCVNSSRSR